MAEKYYKAESKKEWYTSMPVTNDDLQTGCLMRIADAVELMSVNYTRMQNDLDWFKNKYKEQRAHIATLEKRVAAYKGIVKRKK